MERSGLTFMTHCWQFCERLVDDLFPLNLYLRLCWKALGKVLKKKKIGREEKIWRNIEESSNFFFLRSFLHFNSSRTNLFVEKECFQFSRSFEKEKISKMFDRETIFFRRIFSGHRVLILAIHFSNIFRVLIEEECEWSNSSGIISHRFVLPMQIRSTIALTTMIMTTIIHRARVDCIFSP